MRQLHKEEHMPGHTLPIARPARASRAAAWIAGSAIAAALVAASSPGYAKAATAGGTTINNAATATYQDASNHQYTVNSNQVFAYVQNVPSLTISTVNGGNANTATGYPVVPGAVISDLYTITNTGNTAAGGTSGSPTNGLQLNASGTGPNSTTAGGALGTSGVNYIVSLPGGGNLPTTGGACGSTAAPSFASSSLSAINACLATVPLAAGTGSVNVAVQYQVPYNAATGGNAGSNLSATIAYPAVGSSGNFPAQTSTQTAAYTDPIQADARMDLKKASTVNASTDISYAIYANNGGQTATHYADLSTVLPGVAAGTYGMVAIVDPMPQFPAGTYLAPDQAAVATLAAGALNGAQVQIAATGDATGKSGWALIGTPGATQSVPVSNAAYLSAKLLAVVVIGGTTSATAPIVSGGTVACATAQSPCGLTANPTGSSNAGGVATVNTAAAEVTLTFAVKQSTASGSGDTGAYLNVANSVTVTNANTPCLIGPTAGSATATACGTVTVANVLTNSTGSNAPSGASNQTSDKSPAAFSLLLGPVSATNDTPANLEKYAGAIGSYNGAAATNNLDFEARGICWGATGSGSSFLNASGTGTPNTIPYSATNCPNPYAAVAALAPNAVMAFPQVVYNTGNSSDTVVLSATAPAGWQVIFVQDNGSGGPSGTALGNTGFVSTLGNSTSARVTVPSSGTPVTVFWAVYAPTNTSTAIPVMSAINVSITATGQAGSGSGLDANNTWDVMFASFIQMTKASAVTVTGCPSGVSGIPALGVCPGGTIQYTVSVTNLCPSITGATNEPANAVTTVGNTSSPNLVITDDGGVSVGGYSTPNNWASYTNGIASALTVSSNLSGTTVLYGPTGSVPSNSFATGYYAWQATIPGTATALQPSAGSVTGTLTFSVVVK
jgi:hypothetical protein